MMTFQQAVVVFITGALICILLTLVIFAPARAADWPQSEWSKPAPPRSVAKPRRRYKPRPRVKGATFRKINGFVCAREFKVTGDIKATEERAKESAWAAFHGEVKFELGERYADSRFAKRPRFECARSTSETLASKTMEAVGGSGVYRHRCRLRAVACKPPETD
jgi:hypothetical protein